MYCPSWTLEAGGFGKIGIGADKMNFFFGLKFCNDICQFYVHPSPDFFAAMIEGTIDTVLARIKNRDNDAM